MEETRPRNPRLMITRFPFALWALFGCYLKGVQTRWSHAWDTGRVRLLTSELANAKPVGEGWAATGLPLHDASTSILGGCVRVCVVGDPDLERVLHESCGAVLTVCHQDGGVTDIGIPVGLGDVKKGGLYLLSSPARVRHGDEWALDLLIHSPALELLDRVALQPAPAVAVRVFLGGWTFAPVVGDKGLAGDDVPPA